MPDYAVSRVYSVVVTALSDILFRHNQTEHALTESCLLGATCMVQTPRPPDVEAQRAAMKKLGFLVGEWSGEVSVLSQSFMLPILLGWYDAGHAMPEREWPMAL